MGKKLIQHRLLYILLFFVVLLHVLIFLNVVFFPYPELFVYPYLTKIGLVPYKEILDQHFPGIMFLPINLTSLGFNTVSSFRFLSIALICISHIFLLLITKRLSREKYLVLLPNFLYVFWQIFFDGSTVWIESFETPLLLSACYFLIVGYEDSNKKMTLWSGALFGVSIVFKQVVLPLYAALILYMFFRTEKRQLLWNFILGSVIPLLSILLFVLWKGILNDFIYWTVTFNLTVFREMGRKFATNRELISTAFLMAPALVSSAYLFCIKKRNHALFFIFIIFVGSLAFDFARFDFVHLQPAIPFALLLIFLVQEQKKRFLKLLMLGFLVLTVVVGLRSISRQWGQDVRFFGIEDKKVFETVLELSNPGDPIFSLGAYPYIYQVTNTHPSGNVFVFQFPWFMKVAEQRVLEGLVIEPPHVVVRDKDAMADGYNLLSYMPRIKDYIDRYYVVQRTYGSVEILIPR